jgi:hypothetical protein
MHAHAQGSCANKQPLVLLLLLLLLLQASLLTLMLRTTHGSQGTSSCCWRVMAYGQC